MDGTSNYVDTKITLKV